MAPLPINACPLRITPYECHAIWAACRHLCDVRTWIHRLWLISVMNCTMSRTRRHRRSNYERAIAIVMTGVTLPAEVISFW